MKKLILTLSTLAILSSCSDKESSNDSSTDNSQKDSKLITEVLNDIHSLKHRSEKNPIIAFEEIASDFADKEIKISKSTIKEALETAKGYKHCIITAEDHTIVKIDDIDNCTQSGSWGVCMPHAKGYIKKGELVYKEDFINNIIGLPHGEDRVMYLFK